MGQSRERQAGRTSSRRRGIVGRSVTYSACQLPTPNLSKRSYPFHFVTEQASRWYVNYMTHLRKPTSVCHIDNQSIVSLTQGLCQCCVMCDTYCNVDVIVSLGSSICSSPHFEASFESGFPKRENLVILAADYSYCVLSAAPLKTRAPTVRPCCALPPRNDDTILPFSCALLTAGQVYHMTF